MTTVRLGLYANDPPALDTFHSFDPESFVVASLIADPLVHLNADGQMCPNLATSWRQESPTRTVFTLRQGVTFHDGTPLTIRDVLATFKAHLDPEVKSVTGRGILSPLKSIEAIDEHSFAIETKHPDALFLYRLIFPPIYSAAQIEREGISGVATHPIGSGAYSFVEWKRGHHIRLKRNPDHWAQLTQIEELEIPIMPQTQWVEALRAGELDVVFNLDAHDAKRVEAHPELTLFGEPSTLSHHFLFNLSGPLQDERVRRALNAAIHRGLIAEVAEHGNSTPQASLLTSQQIGYEPDLKPEAYDPELARQLLAEAGYQGDLTLKGIVSSTSSAVYLAIKEFLSRVGVTLDAEIVPRGEWMRRVPQRRALGHGVYEGDFALCNIDNPTLHGIFHYFIFLCSHGPFSLLNSPEYDQVFFKAATSSEDQVVSELRGLERYAREHALALFNVNQHVYVAARQGVELQMPISGHFNTETLWKLRVPAKADTTTRPEAPLREDELSTIIRATSHLGIYYREGGDLQDPRHHELWRNLQAHQERWFSQLNPMVRQLVDQAEAKNHLMNVLGSTTRVAILGERDTGKQLFINDGHRQMLGAQPATELELQGHEIDGWDALRAKVREHGAWQGPVTLYLDEQTSKRLVLSATRAHDEQEVPIGYTYVFSDFSGEEERIRNQAQQRIFDHVPYGLFACDQEGRVLSGYSRACDQIFTKRGESIQGQRLISLLAMDNRQAMDFEAQYQQLIEDFMPEELSLAQLPKRIKRDKSVYSLSASTLRDDHDNIHSVLFTMMDITELVAAEREVQRIRGAMLVAQDRAQFASLAQHYLKICKQLGESDDYTRSSDHESLWRRELHTFKGAFGFFGLEEIVEAIHHAEDHHPLRQRDGKRLHDQFVALLQQHEAVWGIKPNVPPRHEIEQADLQALLAQARKSPEQALALIEGFVDRANAVSVSALLGPLPETLERLAKRHDKQIDLKLEGQALLISPKYHDLFHTLPHLIRNALDHGVEPIDERGDKSPTGTITLSVSYDQGHLNITVRDDGRGINVVRVIQKAITNGVIQQEDAASLSHEQALALIFHEGLSTMDTASELSGRGVGMSAVKEAVTALGGELKIESESGKGSTFSLRVPAPEHALTSAATHAA